MRKKIFLHFLLLPILLSINLTKHGNKIVVNIFYIRLMYPRNSQCNSVITCHDLK